MSNAVITKQSCNPMYIRILSLGMFFDSIKKPRRWIVEIETTEINTFLKTQHPSYLSMIIHHQRL